MTTSTFKSMSRGLIWQPGSEQEVVWLFGAILDLLPWPLAIDEIRCAFPDCLAYRTDTGAMVRIEFELYGSHFIAHGHDASQCDVVVCWRDDYGAWPSNIIVWQLAEIIQSHRPQLVQNERPKKEARLWDEGTFHTVATPEVSALVRSLEGQFTGNDRIGVLYNGKGKDATCNVCLRRTGEKVLWIWADGRYQWGDRFRTERELLQKLTGSTQRWFAKPGAVTSHPCDYYTGVLSDACDEMLGGPATIA